MEDDKKKSLHGLREDIDKLDEQILNLLNLRADYAVQTADLKRRNGEGGSMYRPDREAMVVQRVLRLNKERGGSLKEEHVRLLFREIMSACLALEETVTVGFLGPEATFTHEAALRHFGQAAAMTSLNGIAEVFRATTTRNIAFGVVPVENSIEGVVNHTLDLFIDSPLRIVGEIEIKIHHHLLSRCKNREEIKLVYSHEQGFAQCRKWLAVHLPHARQIRVGSTADAARRACEQAAAAIASAAAAERFDLRLLSSNIEDEADNVTRFLVIGDERFETAATGRDKTSIVVSTHNRPGALLELIRPLSENQISNDPSRVASFAFGPLGVRFLY